jgi:hypothetical protein
LLRREHQSSQLRGHFPHSNTPKINQFIGGIRLSLTGLMLAREPALGGADVAVVERRTHQGLDGSRAGGLTPRAIQCVVLPSCRCADEVRPYLGQRCVRLRPRS